MAADTEDETAELAADTATADAVTAGASAAADPAAEGGSEEGDRTAGRDGRRRRSWPAGEPSASSIRTRSTACWASTSPTTTPRSAPPRHPRDHQLGAGRPTSVCRCSRSSSTAWVRLDDDQSCATSPPTTSRLSLDNISSIRFGDYLNSILRCRRSCRCSAAEELDNLKGLLTVDSNLIYFDRRRAAEGGCRGTARMRIEGRPYTTIERVLVERMVEVVLQDCRRGVRAADAGSPSPSTGWEETNPRFAAIARPANSNT